ncbi:MAG TPA: hypothetical protein VFB23_07020 [Candidatus Acidoferrales bacterium]|nr:hypothetical protein [Candidatus Acidoferrales bacterium]
MVAAQAAQGSNHKAIIDSVTFDRPVDALPAVVDEVIEQAKQLEFDGDSGWLNQFAEATIRDTWQKHGYFRASAAQLVQTLSAHVDEQRCFGVTKKISAAAVTPAECALAQIRGRGVGTVFMPPRPFVRVKWRALIYRPYGQ